MIRKPWVITLIVVISLGVLTVAGYAIYRVGYTRGAFAVSEGASMRSFGRFHFMDMDDEDCTMPFNDHRDAMFNKFSHDRFPGNRSTRTRGFVSPFSLFFRCIFFVGFLWLLYWIIRKVFQGQGWQFTFSRTQDNSISPEDETKEQ